MVDRAPHRHRGHRAPAPGRARALAAAAGQEAAQIGSARALRDDDFVFTSYREHAVAWCRGVGPAELLTVWRGSAHPAGTRTTTAWPCPRSSSARRRCTPPATRWAPPGTARMPRASRTSATAPPARATSTRRWSSPPSFDAPVVFFCQNNQWAISEPVGLQAKQPLARRADGFGMPEHARRRQRRARRARGDAHGARPRPARRRPDVHRGRHLPAWARTRPPTTRRATAPTTRSPTGARATRSRACTRCSRTHGRRRRRVRARGRRRGRPRGRRAARRPSRRSPTPSRSTSSTTCTPSRTATWRASATTTPRYLAMFDDADAAASGAAGGAR